MFRIFIKELEFELIDVSTAEKVDYTISATIVRYILVKGRQKFETTHRINGEVTKKEALTIVEQDLNAL